MNKAKGYASVWDALADTPEQAANLRARAELSSRLRPLSKRTAGCKPRPRDTAESLSPHERPAAWPRVTFLARCAGEHHHRDWPPGSHGTGVRLRRNPPIAAAISSPNEESTVPSAWFPAALGFSSSLDLLDLIGD